jgi:hypothetical protein
VSAGLTDERDTTMTVFDQMCNAKEGSVFVVRKNSVRAEE